MNQYTSLKNHFLLAMPGLHDSIFSHSITYLCEHDAEGALGIVINQPCKLLWEDLFDQLELTKASNQGKQSVYIGGPVECERGFVLHTGHSLWESSLAITENLALTSSSDIIQALSEDNGPEKALIAVGYAGWEAGQLEQEMANNSWLSMPASEDILFDTPNEQKALNAAKSLGVDLNLLGFQSGHA